MRLSLALLGCLTLPALVLAQDTTKREMHEMHRRLRPFRLRDSALTGG